MNIPRQIVAVLAAAMIVALGAEGSRLSPVLASGPTTTVTCAVPTGAALAFYQHPQAYGIHAEEMAYDQSRIGCVPTSGPTAKNPLAAAIRQQQRMPRIVPTIGGAWKALGPAPESISANKYSGAVLALAFDANLNSPGGTLFAGTADGGVWSSTDGGTTWATHTDSMPSLTISTIAVDPTDTTGNTIFAGTGDPTNGYDALFGQGVYKSTDGGATWTQEGSGSFGRQQISKIVVDPVTGNVYAGVGTGLFVGRGVWMSTDHGVTWSNPSNLGIAPISDMDIDNLGNVYAAVATYFGPSADGGIWECLAPCASGAHTFTQIGGVSGDGLPGPGTVDSQIKISLADPAAAPGTQTLFASVSQQPNPNVITGVYRASNVGSGTDATWSQILTPGGGIPDGLENQAWFDQYLFADRSDTTHNTLYLGLQDIYVTTNAMATPASSVSWTNLTSTGGSIGTGGIHTDQHAAAEKPDGSTLYFGNDGGVWNLTGRSAGGGTFGDINGNLATMQFYGGAMGTSATEGCTTNCDATLRMGGVQDNGTVCNAHLVAAGTPCQVGGSVWPRLIDQDGGYAAIDPTNNNVMYAETPRENIKKSVDGGKTFASIAPIFPLNCGAESSDSNFIAPFTLDPGDHNTVFAGGGDLCESNNGGTGWKDISNAKTGGVGNISAIAVYHVLTNKDVYMSDGNRNSWVSTDDGTTWTSMNSSSCATNPGPNCGFASFANAPSYNFQPTVSSLAADPNNRGRIYATVNSFWGAQELHVFRSLDFGAHWVDLSTTLPDEPFESVVVNPTNSNIIFAAGITGVFVSQDAGATWSVYGTNLPNAAVYGLQISPDGTTLDAFTHGRGAFEIKTANNPTAAYVSHFTAHRAGGRLLFRWHVAERQGVAGFAMYAGSHRLNQRLIAVRSTGNYHYSVRRTSRGPYQLRVLSKSGRWLETITAG